ncbi:MAG: FMN-binding protein [Lachnospiraceae bacterium]|nr:FMN-binding protein [Lachnospiraceae bacterium]
MKFSRKRIFLSVVIVLFLIVQVSMAAYLKSVADYQNAVKETTFSGIDVSDIPDGVYVGEYDVNFIDVKVEATVQGGEITDIDILKHKNGRGQSAEIVADRIIEEQKIDVDAVSGATNSSTVIKKAVENALKGENG